MYTENIIKTPDQLPRMSKGLHVLVQDVPCGQVMVRHGVAWLSWARELVTVLCVLGYRFLQSEVPRASPKRDRAALATRLGIGFVVTVITITIISINV